MRQFMLLLALFLHGFASDDALAVAAQSSLRNQLKNETVLVAPAHIDGNSMPQAITQRYDADEERLLNLNVLAPVLENVEKARQVVKTKVITPVVEMGRYSTGLAEKALQSLEDLRYNLVLIGKYKEQQEVLASTPKDEQFDKLMLLGHSPTFMLDTFKNRHSIMFTNLPLKERLNDRAYLVQILKFIDHLKATIRHSEGETEAAAPTWQKTYESWTGSKKKIVSSAIKFIPWASKGRSFVYTPQSVITPAFYLLLLIKTGDIGLPNEGAVMIDIINSAKTDILKAIIKGKNEGELIKRANRVENFSQFVKAYESNLVATKKTVETILEAFPEIP